jgi:hypothetical protein
MQQSTDNMSIMARDLCQALGIDITSLLNTSNDVEGNIASSDTELDAPSDMDMDEDGNHHSMDHDAPQDAYYI